MILLDALTDRISPETLFTSANDRCLHTDLLIMTLNNVYWIIYVFSFSIRRYGWLCSLFCSNKNSRAISFTHLCKNCWQRSNLYKPLKFWPFDFLTWSLLLMFTCCHPCNLHSKADVFCKNNLRVCCSFLKDPEFRHLQIAGCVIIFLIIFANFYCDYIKVSVIGSYYLN